MRASLIRNARMGCAGTRRDAVWRGARARGALQAPRGRLGTRAKLSRGRGGSGERRRSRASAARPLRLASSLAAAAAAARAAAAHAPRGVATAMLVARRAAPTMRGAAQPRSLGADEGCGRRRRRVARGTCGARVAGAVVAARAGAAAATEEGAAQRGARAARFRDVAACAGRRAEEAPTAAAAGADTPAAPPPRMASILLVGGTGRVGTAAASHLLRRSGDVRVTLAGRGAEGRRGAGAAYEAAMDAGGAWASARAACLPTMRPPLSRPSLLSRVKS